MGLLGHEQLALIARNSEENRATNSEIFYRDVHTRNVNIVDALEEGEGVSTRSHPIRL